MRASLVTRQLRPFVNARHTLPRQLLSQIQAPLMNALCCTDINDLALTHGPGHLFAHTALLSHRRPHSPSSGLGCLLYAVSFSETCAQLFAASADLHKGEAINFHTMKTCNGTLWHSASTTLPVTKLAGQECCTSHTLQRMNKVLMDHETKHTVQAHAADRKKQTCCIEAG